MQISWCRGLSHSVTRQFFMFMFVFMMTKNMNMYLNIDMNMNIKSEHEHEWRCSDYVSLVGSTRTVHPNVPTSPVSLVPRCIHPKDHLTVFGPARQMFWPFMDNSTPWSLSQRFQGRIIHFYFSVRNRDKRFISNVISYHNINVKESLGRKQHKL
jgi:hypothetical protein